MVVLWGARWHCNACQTVGSSAPGVHCVGEIAYGRLAKIYILVNNCEATVLVCGNCLRKPARDIIWGGEICTPDTPHDLEDKPKSTVVKVQTCSTPLAETKNVNPPDRPWIAELNPSSGYTFVTRYTCRTPPRTSFFSLVKAPLLLLTGHPGFISPDSRRCQGEVGMIISGPEFSSRIFFLPPL